MDDSEDDSSIFMSNSKKNRASIKGVGSMLRREAGSRI